MNMFGTSKLSYKSNTSEGNRKIGNKGNNDAINQNVNILFDSEDKNQLKNTQQQANFNLSPSINPYSNSNHSQASHHSHLSPINYNLGQQLPQNQYQNSKDLNGQFLLPPSNIKGFYQQGANLISNSAHNSAMSKASYDTPDGFIPKGFQMQRELTFDTQSEKPFLDNNSLSQESKYTMKSDFPIKSKIKKVTDSDSGSNFARISEADEYVLTSFQPKSHNLNFSNVRKIQVHFYLLSCKRV